ncbi:MAG: hypothetical protein RSC68_12770 [Acinetobacter sp.]
MPKVRCAVEGGRWKVEGGTSNLPAFSTIFDGNQQVFDLQFDDVATDSGLALLIT